MKRACLLILISFSSLFYSNKMNAQDLCAPIGWATLNGGTTGGGNSTPINVSTLADLQTQAKSTGAKVIYVSGVLGTGVGTRVLVTANKTIIGLPGATLFGGFDIKSNNVIIRNMIVKGPGSVDVNGVDCITIDGTAATNIWIDHCDIYDGQDGNMDIANGANYIAVTWCKFSYTSASVNHQFCNLLGNSDTKTTDRGKLKITMMYNWWTTGCVERMPRVRFGQVHVVNNYFNSKQSSYCVRAGIEADILVESNYFDSVSTPIDLYQNNFTAVTSRNNFYNATRGNSAGSGTSFTPPYSLTITPAVNLKSIVSKSAGATLSGPNFCGTSTNTSYTLTTSANPTVGGTVTAGGTYNSGTTVTLTATPAAGYTFSGWSGDATGTSITTTVTMNANKTVTANFTQTPSTFVLTTSANPTAGGTVTAGGTYNSVTTVTLTATPAAGYTFSGWSGDATGNSTTTTVTMNANKTVTANFTQTPSTFVLTTSANPTAGGTVTAGGTYNSGTIVTLTATPAAGYTFSGWSGDATGTAATTSVTMNANKSVVANFTTTATGGTTIRIEDNATTTTGLCLVEGAISSNSGANNGKVINLTNSTLKGVNWKINVPTSGTYKLNWRYVNSSTSNTYTMALLINGVVVNGALGFPKTAGSTIFSNTIVSLNLNAGPNTIRLQSVASNATADIDWIEITGDNPVAGNCTIAARPAIHSISNNIFNRTDLFPNPAKSKTTIRFSLKESETISLKVFDKFGRMVDDLGSRNYGKGNHQIPYSFKHLPAGMYFIKTENRQGQTSTSQLIIL